MKAVLLEAVLVVCMVFAGLLGVMIFQGYKTLGEWAEGIHMEELPDYGGLIPLKEWQAEVAAGSLIPYDGSGRWATSKEMDGASDVWNSSPPRWATHVMWFNK